MTIAQNRDRENLWWVSLSVFTILAFFLVHHGTLGTVSLPLLTLVSALCAWNARQVFRLCIERQVITDGVLTGSEWQGILALRCATLFVLLSVLVYPAPSFFRSSWFDFFAEIESLSIGPMRETFRISDTPILLGVFLTLLPLTRCHESSPAENSVRFRTLILWLVFVLVLAFLSISESLIVYFTNIATSAVKVGLPRRLFNGEILLPENLHYRSNEISSFRWSVLPVIASSIVALIGSLVAIAFRKWTAMGILIWACGAAIAIPQLIWLVFHGWKRQFAFHEIDGFPLEFNPPSLVMACVAGALVLAFMLTKRTRPITDSASIRVIHSMMPTTWIYMLVLGTICFHLCLSKLRLSQGMFLVWSVGLFQILLFNARHVWQDIARQPRWIRLIPLLGYLVASAFVATTFYPLIRRSSVALAVILVVVFSVLVFGWILVQFFREASEVESTELFPIEIRDWNIGTNILLVPMFLLSVLMFYVATALTFPSFIEHTHWYL
ncbi:MAG: hypothetical protein JNL67_12175 [Planctomycetaceae bacterium]|nr:hypothetical protein [Planctomycetaceae bacterium]